MKKEKGHDSFHLEKGKKGDYHTSFVGYPNSNMDTYRKKDGHFIGRRKYGRDGYAIKDYDTADSHKNYDHVHDITRASGRNSKERKPDKREAREINKAKRKRRILK